MRISDWSSDVCSSDLSLRMRSCTARPVFDFFPGVLPRKRSRKLFLRGLAVLACFPDLAVLPALPAPPPPPRSEEHTSELQSLMRISYAVFCLKKKKYK